MEVADLIPGWKRIIPKAEALAMLESKTLPGFDPGQPQWKWDYITMLVRTDQAVLGESKDRECIRILLRDEGGCTHN